LRKILVIPSLAAAAVVGIVAMLAVSATNTTHAQAPGPNVGSQLVSGLLNPRGMKVGPDGMIYVAEAGHAGDMQVGPADSPSTSGFTGRISKVDPATGTRTTVADNLPSNGGPEGDSVGPADVAFIGNQLYYVQTHGGEAYGFPDNPTGLYKVNGNGTVTLVADIGAFNIANPVDDITVRHQPDIEIGGNPYSMVVRDGNFYVSDGNQNQIMKITPAGAITRVTDFPGHPVTTGITFNGSGPFYVTTLGQFPFAPADGSIRQVGFPTGTQTTVASGVSSLTDVEFGPGGQLYATNFMDQATDPNSPLPWTPFTGKLMKVDVSTGTFTPVATGFVALTAVIFIGNTAYLSNNGVDALAPGEIWQIPNVSSLAPLAVSPTAVPTTAAAATATPVTGIVAPNTGTGSAAGGNGGVAYAIALLAGISGIALIAGGRRALRSRAR
jgi:hypothetical protein